jgi:hemerythrin
MSCKVIVVSQNRHRAVRQAPSEEMIGIVTTAIGDWLLNHIKGDDFRMAAYVKAKSAEQES